MNETIGPYQVLREVGRGGMGVVYLARDSRLERDVAIKALPEEMAQDPARLERFEKEARAIAGLSHQNIAGIYGIEEQDGGKFLILEYINGLTLADRLDDGPMPIEEAIEIAVQIAAGIESAHEAGIVHRDLKPANIKVDSDGVVKILDFGLAKSDEGLSTTGAEFDGPTIPQHSPTIAGAILGTAAYMSPEQARGRRVDKRTDIWSTRCSLDRALSKARPRQTRWGLSSTKILILTRSRKKRPRVSANSSADASNATKLSGSNPSAMHASSCKKSIPRWNLGSGYQKSNIETQNHVDGSGRRLQ